MLPLPRSVAFLCAAAAAVALGAVCLAAALAAPVGAAPGLWRPQLDGLYGDRVAGLEFVGPPGGLGRSYVLLPEGYGLYRFAPDEGAWSPVAANPERPAGVVRSVRAAPGDANGMLVYAGLEGRTLFARSEDSGYTWRALPGPAGPRRLDLLAVTKAGQLFAAEAGGTSVFTSNDRGDSWSPKAGPPSGAPIAALFVAPDEPVVYAVAGERLYRLDPTPSSWSEVLGPATTPAMQVRLAAAGPRGRLYAAGQMAAGSRVYASEDRGASWPSSGWPEGTGAEPRALTAGEVTGGLPAVWLGLADGQVQRSTSAGSGWQALGQVPLAVTLVAIDPASGDVWVGSDGLGLYRLAPSFVHTGAVPVDVMALAAPTYSQDQRIFLNAQVLPDRRVNGVPIPALHGLFESAGDGLWERRVMTTVMGVNLLASPGYATDRRLYSGQRLTINEGATWVPLGPAPGGQPPFVAAVGPISGTLPVVYALVTPYVDGIGGAGLVRSEDGGDAWLATDVSVDHIVDVDVSPRYPVDHRAWFLTESGAVYRTSDGLSFSQVGQVPTSARQHIAYDLVLSPDYANDNTLFAAVEDPANTQQARVYVSTNAGAGLWQDRSGGLPARGRPRRLVLSPSFRGDGVMFLGAERLAGDPEVPTLLGSDAAGEAWYGEQVLPPSSVSDLLWLGPLRGGKLYAAAGTAGLWVRDLDGPPAALPTVTPTPTTTATPSVTATPGPATATPTATPTLGTGTPPPSPVPTATPSATATPSPSPTQAATATSTVAPSATMTRTPVAPSLTPTSGPGGHLVYLPFAVRQRARSP
jgi:hypothetical protein